MRLAIGLQVFEGAHVVQAVGELDEHYADVVDHGEHHLAQVFGLRFFARGEINLADLGDAFDDVRDLLTKFFADIDDGDRGVFDRVVQQAGGDRDRVHFHLGEHLRHFEWVNQVRLTRGAGLAFVMLQGVVVGFLNDGEIVLRTIFLDPLHQLAELGEGESGGRDLLAQARHVGLYPAERAESEGGPAGCWIDYTFPENAGSQCAEGFSWNESLECSNWNISLCRKVFL